MKSAPTSSAKDSLGSVDAVSMVGIRKSFGSTVALEGAEFYLRHGEIHALLGENGAGKSTLMNILYGLEQRDDGEIMVDGVPVNFGTPQDAVAKGIGMVHQHFKLVPRLSVIENVLLSDRRSRTFRLPDLDVAAKQLEELADRYGLPICATDQVSELSVGEQQRVEILRSLYLGAKTLILDEPTASLTPLEVNQLLAKLRDLANTGTSIIIITHHLDEVMESADRVTVLRSGSNVRTTKAADTSQTELARMMVGRDVRILTQPNAMRSQPSEQLLQEQRRPVLQLAGVGASSHYSMNGGDDGLKRGLLDISLAVHPGEIVAIAGVEGNGQTELEDVLSGFLEVDEGEFWIDGNDLTSCQPSDLLNIGVGYIPSDRYRRGVIGGLSVAVNISYDRVSEPPIGTRLWVNSREIMKQGSKAVEEFSIVVRDAADLVGTLSGGNAQRVVIARALAKELRLLVAAQPTRGLDVGAIEFIWDLLDQQRSQGLATVLITTDLDEVMALADRVYVMYRGRLREVPNDRELIGLAMGGLE
jgi:general nucleoside transport system ATP-binding protein